MAIVPFKRNRIPYTFFNANLGIMAAILLALVVSLLYSALPFYLSLSRAGLQSGFIWELFTHHLTLIGPASSTVLNLVFSLLALLFFGSQVEREMGSVQYLIYYFGIGFIVGILGLGIFAVLGIGDVFIFGPSVAVFAVSVAFAAFYPDRTIYIMGIIPLRPVLLVLLYVVIDMAVLLFSEGTLTFIHLLGFVLAYLWMLVRYKRNIFRDIFR